MIEALVIVGSVVLVLTVLCLVAVLFAPSLDDMDTDRL